MTDSSPAAIAAPEPAATGPRSAAGGAGGGRRRRGAEALLLLALLAVYGATINTRALYHASLHQGVVRALVERGTLYLRHFDPREPLGGDVFVHDGRVYANKQPGSLLLGAGVYRLLRLAGLRYQNDLYLTAAWVSLLTSGLLTALTALLLRRLAMAGGSSPGWALGVALAYGLGTTALPYAGILHHDVVATACLVGAWTARRSRFAAGALLGLALFASLLPLPMVATMTALLLLEPEPGGGRPPRPRRDAALLAGLALGATPLLITQWASLGAPWRMPLLTSGLWPESSPRVDPGSALQLLALDLKLLLWYAPIVLPALLGLGRLALREWRRPAPPGGRIGLLVAPATAPLLLALSQLAFVASLGTDGSCQYGPRLLLPAIPFACLGLAAFEGTRWSRAAAAALIAVGLVSFGINLVGALYGTMFCDSSQWAFAHYLDALRHHVHFSFPLLGIEGEAPY